MKKAIYFLFAFFLFTQTRAQDARKDLRLRTGIKANIDLPKGMSAAVQYQYRANNNISAFSGSYFTGTWQFTLVKKKLFAEAEYRFSTNRTNDLHRFGSGLQHKWQKGNFTVSNRLVWQRRQTYFGNAYEPGREPYSFLRYRLQLKYKVQENVAVYSSVEPFYKLSSTVDELRRIRYTAGCNVQFKNGHAVDVFYFIQPDYNNAPRDITYNIGLMYELDLVKKKSKKDKKKEDDWF